MKKKVYFAGSIRGGRADAELYSAMIMHIQKTDEVLTEHVGDVSLSALERGPEGDSAIYRQDTAWLNECDLVIAECTCPSLGVGYELCYAEARKKPCYILYNMKVTQLSAMLTGDSYFNIIPYESADEVFAVLDGILAD